MIRHLFALAVGFFAIFANGPVAAQTVSGCGTLAIAKASNASIAKLTTEATCFGKARDTAATAVIVRQTRIAQLTPVPAPPAPPAPPATGKTAVGMNLAGISNYSPELPFLDYFKSAGAPANNPKLDALGNVTDIGPNPDGAGYSINLDPGPATYVILYDGSPAIWSYRPGAFGTNSMLGNGTITSVAPGRMVLSTTGGPINFSINGIDPANPIRNIHIVRADQEAAFKAGAIFNPDFLALVSHFSALRTMGWGCTNGSQVVSWSQRWTPARATWDCVPIEVQIALANAANADLWLNIPAHADDDYIRQAVTLARDTLAPSLKLHLEYSNEVWNTSFEQSGWSSAQGTARWGNVGWPNEVWYGYRAAQMAAIARSVFGAAADQRLSPVLATFPGWGTSEVDDAIASGVAKAGVGAIGSLFKEYAATTYYGDELGVFPGNEVDRATVLGWAASGEDGLAKAFKEIEFGGTLQQNLSLAWRASSYARHAAQAKAWGLDLVAYEGGLSWTYFMAPDKAPYDAFLTKVATDPRMGPLTTKMVTSFGAGGGKLLMYLEDVGPLTQWGPWGAQPDLKTQTPRSQALIDASGR